MIGGIFGFGLVGMLEVILGLIGLVLWILPMIKAFQHENFRVPVAAGIADGIANK